MPNYFRLVACVRDSESMQRAVWRKNSDTFYVAIEKKEKGCPLGEKRYGTGKTENRLIRHRKDRVL